MQSDPIVRVAIEPESVTDMARLSRGLKLLNQADANVQVILVFARALHSIAALIVFCVGVRARNWRASHCRGW